jgi:hypothetical protein
MTPITAIARVLTTMAIVAGATTHARAQLVTTFSELPLRLDLGDTITVVDTDGARVRGRILDLTPGSIVVERGRVPVTLASDRVRQIGRCCDSLKNGAIIGAVAWGGLAFMAGFTFAEGGHVGSDLLAGAIFGGLFGGLGAGLGAGIDALIARDVLVYRPQALRIGVKADFNRRALLVTLRF